MIWRAEHWTKIKWGGSNSSMVGNMRTFLRKLLFKCCQHLGSKLFRLCSMETCVKKAQEKEQLWKSFAKSWKKNYTSKGRSRSITSSCKIEGLNGFSILNHFRRRASKPGIPIVSTLLKWHQCRSPADSNHREAHSKASGCPREPKSDKTSNLIKWFKIDWTVRFFKNLWRIRKSAKPSTTWRNLRTRTINSCDSNQTWNHKWTKPNKRLWTNQHGCRKRGSALNRQLIRAKKAMKILSCPSLIKKTQKIMRRLKLLDRLKCRPYLAAKWQKPNV